MLQCSPLSHRASGGDDSLEPCYRNATRRGVASHRPLPDEELDTAEGKSGGDPPGDDDIEPRRAARRDNQLVDQRRRHHAPRGDRMLLTPWATLSGRVGAIVMKTGRRL
jgi:hypothetical protein